MAGGYEPCLKSSTQRIPASTPGGGNLDTKHGRGRDLISTLPKLLWIYVYSEMKKTVFTSGGSQAVRIPKEFRIDAKRVEIERKGATLVLRPLPDDDSWPEGYLESFAAGKLDDSFGRGPQGEHREMEF
jgi:antitoxin VapB